MGDVNYEKLEETTEKLEALYEVAAKLTKKWFPDTEKYKNQRRIAILSLMKMMTELVK